jgi:hypothetical protein
MCQLGAERGKGGLSRGRFTVMEAETRRCADAARGTAGPGEEGGSPGRSRPAWRLGLVGQISIGKKSKGF